MKDSNNQDVLSDEEANKRVAELDFLSANYLQQSREAGERASSWRQIESNFDEKIRECKEEKDRVTQGTFYAEKLTGYPFEQVKDSVERLNRLIIGYEHKRFLSLEDWEQIKFQMKQTKLFLHRYIAKNY